jgi:hypothetical protein
VLRHQDSVEQSLAWLGAVGEGLANAYNPHFTTTDVRSDRVSAGICEDFDDLPIDPGDFPPPLDEILEDLLEQIQNELCPAGAEGPSPVAPQPNDGGDPPAPPSPPEVLPDLKLDCKEALKKAKQQIRRIEEVGIPDDLKAGLLEPLEENLKELGEKCETLGDVTEDPEALDELLEGLPEDLRALLEEALQSDGGSGDDSAPVDDLSGNASGAALAPTPETNEEEDSWIDGMLRFLGVSS